MSVSSSTSPGCDDEPFLVNMRRVHGWDVGIDVPVTLQVVIICAKEMSSRPMCVRNAGRASYVKSARMYVAISQWSCISKTVIAK